MWEGRSCEHFLYLTEPNTSFLAQYWASNMKEAAPLSEEEANRLCAKLSELVGTAEVAPYVI